MSHAAAAIAAEPERRRSPAALSSLHAALAGARRVYEPDFLDRLANDPSIYPTVAGHETGTIGLAEVAENPDNICLTGKHGAMVFTPIQRGLYEIHSMCLPDGRGRWMLSFARACLHYAFTRTGAVEVLTRCPEGNLGAVTLARACGLAPEFTVPNGWALRGKWVPATVYGSTLQAWARAAPGLIERGRWFHDRLEAEFARHGAAEEAHEDDADHDRAVGLALEMAIGGMPDKAVVFYHRVARIANYGLIEVINRDPLTVDIGNAVIIVRDDDLWVAAVRQKGH